MMSSVVCGVVDIRVGGGRVVVTGGMNGQDADSAIKSIVFQGFFDFLSYKV